MLSNLNRRTEAFEARLMRQIEELIAENRDLKIRNLELTIQVRQLSQEEPWNLPEVVNG